MAGYECVEAGFRRRQAQLTTLLHTGSQQGLLLQSPQAALQSPGIRPAQQGRLQAQA